jgi:spore maturation protein CgeB
MKILFVQSNYPDFLKKFYAKHNFSPQTTYREIKEEWQKEWFGSADFYAKNIKKYGWEADEIIINDVIMQSRWAKEHGLKIQTGEPFFLKNTPESIKNLLGLRGWMKQILEAQIKLFKPDVTYMHDLSIFEGEDIKRIKRWTKIVVGQIACPLPINHKPLYEYDLMVSSFPHYVLMFRDWGINSEYLAWCMEKEIPLKIGPKKRIYNTVYIGGLTSAHSQGNQILEKLAKEIRVDVWGYGENTLPPNSAIKRNFHGQAWGREMYEIFAKAKIVINRHINVAGNVANNMRMFEATGMGSLLITDDKPNMEEFFRVGKEVVTYKNANDLIAKVKYYLKHTTEREQIAKAGQKRTLNDHTYEQRMRDLDQILRKHL